MRGMNLGKAGQHCLSRCKVGPASKSWQGGICVTAPLVPVCWVSLCGGNAGGEEPGHKGHAGVAGPGQAFQLSVGWSNKDTLMGRAAVSEHERGVGVGPSCPILLLLALGQLCHGGGQESPPALQSHAPGFSLLCSHRTELHMA